MKMSITLNVTSAELAEIKELENKVKTIVGKPVGGVPTGAITVKTKSILGTVLFKAKVVDTLDLVIEMDIPEHGTLMMLALYNGLADDMALAMAVMKRSVERFDNFDKMVKNSTEVEVVSA